MTKIVTDAELQDELAAVIDWVRSRREEVIVESRPGTPDLVIAPYSEFVQLNDELTKLREQERRRAAGDEVRAIGARAAARNQDLTPEQVEELADRFSHEFVEELLTAGKIRFEVPPTA